MRRRVARPGISYPIGSPVEDVVRVRSSPRAPCLHSSSRHQDRHLGASKQGGPAPAARPPARGGGGRTMPTPKEAVTAALNRAKADLEEALFVLEALSPLDPDSINCTAHALNNYLTV